MATPDSLAANMSVEALLRKGFEDRNKTRLVLSYDNITTEKFGTLNFSASFPCFLPPEYYYPVDEEELSKMADRIIEYYYQVSFDTNEYPRGCQEMEKIRKIAMFTMRSGCFPLIPKEVFTSEMMMLSVAFIVGSVFLDDVSEQGLTFGQIGADRIVEHIDQVDRYLRGSESHDWYGPPTYKHMVPYQTVMKSALDRMSLLSPQYHHIQDHFLRFGKDFALAMYLLQRAELDSSVQYGEWLDRYLHHKDSAVLLFVELLLITLGIHVPEDIRSGFLFCQTMDKLNAMGRTTNDIFSLGKEIRLGEYGSPLLSRVTTGKMSMEESFKIAENEARDVIQDLLELGSLFLMLYPESEQIQRFVLFMGQQIDVFGHLFDCRGRYPDVTRLILE